MDALVAFLKTSDATPRDIVIVQSYMDGVFRLIILLYALALSVLAFTRGYIVITLIISAMIILSITYAYFTLIVVGGALMDVEGYHPFNVIFYYIMTTFLAILFLVIIFFFIKPFQRGRKSKGAGKSAVFAHRDGGNVK